MTHVNNDARTNPVMMNIEWIEHDENIAVFPRKMGCGHWVCLGNYIKRVLRYPRTFHDGEVLSTECLECHEKRLEIS